MIWKWEEGEVYVSKNNGEEKLIIKKRPLGRCKAKVKEFAEHARFKKLKLSENARRLKKH